MMKKCTRIACCRSANERMQLENSKRIDADLAVYKRRFFATQKIVLIGAAESGKTTFLKQMQIIHGAGFTHDEKLTFRTQIYENILKGMAGLLNGKRELKLAWRGSFVQNNNHEPKEIAERMHYVVQQFTVHYKRLVDERYAEAKRMRKYLHIQPAEFAQTVGYIIEIWNDDAIRETFDRKRELPKYFVENVPYYIEHIDRICRPEYVPDSNDILRCRRATTGIVEIEIDIKNVPFRFVDVGGQRTQRQKWHQCLSDVTAILFLASSSEYDEYLREDGRTNRLEESCKVFETLVNFRYLKTVEFIIFFNKHDLLKDKIKKVNIKDYCADFQGNARSLADVEAYLVRKFASLKHRGGMGGDESRPVSSSSLQVETTTHAESGGHHGGYELIQQRLRTHDKSVYSHFTTAIDTNNIKTIFEMVRLMIFEKNCKAVLLN